MMPKWVRNSLIIMGSAVGILIVVFFFLIITFHDGSGGSSDGSNSTPLSYIPPPGVVGRPAFTPPPSRGDGKIHRYVLTAQPQPIYGDRCAIGIALEGESAELQGGDGSVHLERGKTLPDSTGKAATAYTRAPSGAILVVRACPPDHPSENLQCK